MSDIQPETISADDVVEDADDTVTEEAVDDDSDDSDDSDDDGPVGTEA